MAEDWGTTRERNRIRRRWKWVAVAAILVAIAPLASAFGLGLIEGLWSARHPARAIGTRDHVAYLGVAIMMAVAAGVHLHLWRGSDEVQRRGVVAALALSGAVALVSLPVLALAQRPLGLESPAMIGWGLAAAVLIGTRIVQRLRA